MKHDEKLTRARILEILECDEEHLDNKIYLASYEEHINAEQVIYSIMFLWEDAGYVITKPPIKI